MATLSDSRFESLRGQGFTGATSDMLLQWLQANGATAGAVPDAWREMLEANGYTYGQRNDAWYAFLGDLGYEGSLPDRELGFWEGGGTISPDGVRIVVHPVNANELERGTATFTVVATSGNGSPLTYQWQEYITGVGWQDYTGETSDSTSITPLEVEDDTRTFRVRVCNSYNCLNSKSAEINITGAWWFIMAENGDRIQEEVTADDTIDENSEDTPYPG